MSDPWEIATWRFEMISALLDANQTEGSKTAHYTRADHACCPVAGFTRRDRPIGKSTLFRWLKNYREKGFLGLMPKTRKDKGTAPIRPLCLQINYALGLLYEQPERSLTQLMLYLELEFGKLSISRSTLSRDLHAHPAFARNFATSKGHGQKTAGPIRDRPAARQLAAGCQRPISGHPDQRQNDPGSRPVDSR